MGTIMLDEEPRRGKRQRHPLKLAGYILANIGAGLSGEAVTAVVLLPS